MQTGEIRIGSGLRTPVTNCVMNPEDVPFLSNIVGSGEAKMKQASDTCCCRLKATPWCFLISNTGVELKYLSLSSCEWHWPTRHHTLLSQQMASGVLAGAKEISST